MIFLPGDSWRFSFWVRNCASSADSPPIFLDFRIALDDSDKGARFLRQAFSWTLLTTWLARSTRGEDYSRETAARRFRHSGDPVKNNHSSVPEIVVNHPGKMGLPTDRLGCGYSPNSFAWRKSI